MTVTTELDAAVPICWAACVMVWSLFALLSPLYLCLPDSIEEGEVGVGRQGGNQGEGSRDQDPEAEQPFASDELSHSPSRHLE